MTYGQAEELLEAVATLVEWREVLEGLVVAAVSLGIGSVLCSVALLVSISVLVGHRVAGGR